MFGPSAGLQLGFRVSVGPACLKAWEKLRCLIQVEVKKAVSVAREIKEEENE